jgi:hypothetical protein
MIRVGKLAKSMLCALAGVLLVAAGPKALAPAQPGLWEVSRSADGRDGFRTCVGDVAMLAQWEHRHGRCTRVVISDVGTKASIHYTCADGGFGRSDMTLLTPRTLRISTQGISASYPFAYTLHARRIGNCPAH